MPAVREGARGVDGVAGGDGRRGPTMVAVEDGPADPGEALACPDRRTALLAVELGVRLPLEVALSLADHLRVCAACRGDVPPEAAADAPDPAPAEPWTPAFAPSPAADPPVARPRRGWSGARHAAALSLACMTAAVVFVTFGLVGRGGPARRVLVEGPPQAPRQTLAVSGTTSVAPASAAPAVASRAAATATPHPATVVATRSRPSEAGAPAGGPPPPQPTGAATPAPTPAPSPSPSPTPTPLPLPLPTPPPF